jgi:hypothetical protein
MRALVSVTLTSLMAGSAAAADMKMSIEIPRLTVAEYHRPYVAIWLEKPDQSFVGNLAVWYDYKLKNNEGTNWLKDMRQWWRRSGRDLQMPVDGLTGATRAPGEHQVTFPIDKAPLSGLAPGEYQLVVEAAREVGGREILRIPFQWPPKAPETLKAPGKDELGAVTLSLNP